MTTFKKEMYSKEDLKNAFDSAREFFKFELFTKDIGQQNLTEFFTIFSNSLIFYDSFTDQQFKKNQNQ